MGGLLLLLSIIGTFIIVYWFLYVEKNNNISSGFLGILLIPSLKEKDLPSKKKKLYLSYKKDKKTYLR